MAAVKVYLAASPFQLDDKDGVSILDGVLPLADVWALPAASQSNDAGHVLIAAEHLSGLGFICCCNKELLVCQHARLLPTQVLAQFSLGKRLAAD